jgi:Fe-Mn family superoxide dismutase
MPNRLINRRQVLFLLGATAGATALDMIRSQSALSLPIVRPMMGRKQAEVTGPYTLPPLPYEYDALAPTIDAETMQLHHDLHHGGYVKNLNTAVSPYPELQAMSPEELV